MKRNRRLPAFTLIELLVVIAIIAILAALLMPALERARGQAVSTACLNSARPLYMAFQSYHADWNEAFPWGWLWEHRDSAPLSTTFVWQDQYGVHQGLTWATCIFSYTNGVEAFFCPNQKYRRWGTYAYPGYTYNGYLCGYDKCNSRSSGPYGDILSPVTRPCSDLWRRPKIPNAAGKVLIGCAAEGQRPDGAVTCGHPYGDFSWDMPRYGVGPYQWNSWPAPGGDIVVNKKQSGCPVVFILGNARVMDRKRDLFGNQGAYTPGDTNRWLDPLY